MSAFQSNEIYEKTVTLINKEKYKSHHVHHISDGTGAVIGGTIDDVTVCEEDLFIQT